MVILLWNLGKLQNLKFQLIAVQFSGRFIINLCLTVADVILLIVGEIQNTDMYTFLKPIIFLTFAKLAGKHLAQIKQTPVVPVFHIYNLHLNIKLSAVFQKNMNIQHSLLFLLRPFGKFIFQNNSIPDLLR